MFGAAFDQVTRVVGKLKDDSLEIDSLSPNNCLCHRNVFQNGVNTLSKMVNHFGQMARSFI